MKVFMLGWEFPPIVSGGLGVACYGLAKALNALGVDILFVLPKPLTGNGHAALPAQSLQRHVHRVRQLPAASQNEVHSALEHAAEQMIAVQATDRAGAEEPPPAEPLPPDAGPAPVAVAEAVPALPQGAGQPVGQSAIVPSPGAIESPAAPTLAGAGGASPGITAPEGLAVLERVTFIPVDVLLQPYMTVQQYQRMVVEHFSGARWAQRAMSSGPHQPAAQPANTPSPAHVPAPLRAAPAPPRPVALPITPVRPSHYLEHHGAPPKVVGPANSNYAGDLFAETDRYARLALAVAKGENFDLVHAHDWMTFEAAIAVAAAADKPLVVQIHSTELDRAGVNANGHIMELERQGMLAADRIIAVSYKTKTQLIEKYGIDPQKIEVVYNATDPATPAPAKPAIPAPRPAKKSAKPRREHKTVLFLGRLTQQKGPDLFLHAAKKVLSVEPDVRFVVAGKGEMLDLLKDLADQLEIRRHVIFTGFLKKNQAEKAFAAANVYVMPSISEPFGIATLEALAHDVPVIVSKQSGVAEVLRHVLKVDFWDTEDLANKILAVLRHPPLAATLREQGQEEVRQLSWEDSAGRISEVYNELERSKKREPQKVLQ